VDALSHVARPGPVPWTMFAAGSAENTGPETQDLRGKRRTFDEHIS